MDKEIKELTTIQSDITSLISGLQKEAAPAGVSHSCLFFSSLFPSLLETRRLTFQALIRVEVIDTGVLMKIWIPMNGALAQNVGN